MQAYSKGWRYGEGKALAVAKPSTLVDIWKILQICVEYDVIVIMQAANTGLTGGSTPYGDDYDRPILIINTMRIDTIHTINNGKQVLGLSGSTLFKLEKMLKPFDREPHSVIGSSCIGASIVGGICNNSGGSLISANVSSPKFGKEYSSLCCICLAGLFSVKLTFFPSLSSFIFSNKFKSCEFKLNTVSYTHLTLPTILLV